MLSVNKKKWWVIHYGKRKAKYSPEARKHHQRKYKAMAEDVASLCVRHNLDPLDVRSFFNLPIMYRRYCDSLVRNRIIK